MSFETSQSGRSVGRVGWPAAAAVGGVVVACGLLAWSLSGIYFVSDDFTNVGVSRDQSFGWAYLTDSLFGHFLPGYRFVFKAYDTLFGGSYWPVTVYQVIGLALTAFLIWRLGRALRASEVATCVAVLLFAFSFFLVPSESWLSAALNVWPANLAALGVILCHLRFVRTGAWWAGALSVIVLASGVSFYETTFFVLVFVGSFVVLHEAEIAPAEPRRTYVRRNVAMFAAYVVLAVAYWGYFLLHPYSDEIPEKGTIGSTIRFAYYAVFEAFLPGLVGRHIDLTTSPGQRVLSIALGLAVLGLIVGGTLVLWRNAWRAWIVGALVLVPHVLFVGLARSGIGGAVYGREIRYFGDIAWLLPVVIVLASTGPRRVVDRFPARSLRYLGRASVALAAVLCVCLGFASRNAFANSEAANSKKFRDKIDQTMAHAEAEGYTGIYDLPVPCCIHIPQQYPYNLLSRTFGLYDRRLSTTMPSHVVDSSGALVKARYAPTTVLVEDPVCTDPSSGDLDLLLPAFEANEESAHFVRINWADAVGAPGSLELLTEKGKSPAGPNTTIPVERSTGEAVVALWLGQDGRLVLRSDGLESICITGVEVGIPLTGG